MEQRKKLEQESTPALSVKRATRLCQRTSRLAKTFMVERTNCAEKKKRQEAQPRSLKNQ